MSDIDCVRELCRYEAARANHLESNGGSLEHFGIGIDPVVLAELQANQNLKAHLEMPEHLNQLTLSSVNRRSLLPHLSMPIPESRPVTDEHVQHARSFVAELLNQDLSKIQLILASSNVMRSSSLGTVYSNQATQHIVVVPEASFDPIGILVHQFAVAAHYSAMRERETLAGMVTDPVTQKMIGQFALLRWLVDTGDAALVLHLRDVVQWEVAMGLSRTPTYPMGLVVSDLGEALIKDYGPDAFKGMMVDLYESATDGQAIFFGAHSFIGRLMAMAFLDDADGIRRFITIEAGDRTLHDKLTQSMTRYRETTLEDANQVLSQLISKIELSGI